MQFYKKYWIWFSLGGIFLTLIFAPELFPVELISVAIVALIAKL
jgi:hypothetical protein